MIAAAVFALSACSNTETVTQEIYETPVAVAEAFTGSLSGSNQITGTARAGSDIQIISQASGQLTEILVSKGATVEKGQVLAKIDNENQLLSLEAEKASLKQAQNALQRAQNGQTQARNNLEQARAGLRQAESSMLEAKQGREHNINNLALELQNVERQWQDAQTNVERMKALYDEQLISLQQYEEAKAAELRARNAVEQLKLNQRQAESQQSINTLQASVDQAKINVQVAEANIKDADIAVQDAQVAVEQRQISLQMAQKRVDETIITAPAAGQLTNLNISVGEFISAQSPFASIISTDAIEVVASISADRLMLMEIGDTVEVRFSGVTEPKQGTVSYISTSADSSGLFTIEVQVKNENNQLRPGMVATIIVEQVLVENSVIVPTSAIIERQGIAYVYVTQGNAAILTEIEVSRYDTGFSAITGDIHEGDKVVVKGQNLLSDGDPIRIVKEEK